jgi:lipopolysaccharide/colanic/teichoic acid biosynthesis glycosyltransferase
MKTESSVPQFAGDFPARIPTPVSRQQRRLDAAEHTRGIERPRSVEVARLADRPAVAEVFPSERAEGLSRAFNLLTGLIGLLLLLPLFILIAVAIRLSSRGPVIYAQTRVGLDRRWRETLALRERRLEDLGGQVFTIFKFRTMRVDAERFSGAVWAQAHDPRVTPIGRFLRKFRLDELPQLWNIVRGDMNIVGPRPERPSIAARLREDIPEYRFRHRVRPGLTGLAQINQHYDACLEDVRAKVRWDLTYLRTQSLWLDVRIILQTVPAVLLKFRGW